MSDVENNATEDEHAGDLRGLLEDAYETEEIKANEEETESSANGKDRDDKGRFKKKETETETDTTLTEQTAETQTVKKTDEEKAAEQAAAKAAAENQTETQTTTTEIKPPQSWSPRAKEIFSKLDPETQGALQQELSKRETDYSRGIQRYAEKTKFADSIQPTLDPWLPYINAKGVTPAQAIQELLNAEYVLQTGSPQEKFSLFMSWAKAYDVDISSQQTQASEAQAEGNQGYDITKDPRYIELHESTRNLEGRLNKAEYERQQEAKTIQEQEEAAMNTEIEAFSSDPKFPHYQKLKPAMSQLLISGRATSLEDAYEQAGWLDPEIRASLIKDLEAKGIEEKVNLANQAKKKAKSITGSPSGAEAKTKPQGIRASLEDAWEEAGGD